MKCHTYIRGQPHSLTFSGIRRQSLTDGTLQSIPLGFLCFSSFKWKIPAGTELRVFNWGRHEHMLLHVSIPMSNCSSEKGNSHQICIKLSEFAKQTAGILKEVYQ